MIERSLAFGADAGLVGTVCLPEPGSARAGVGLVLFNAGVVHRVGPHRINVRLARTLAARGIPSIRFDLAGQGDSARAAGSRSFEEQAVADLRSAMDTLGTEAGLAKFALFGFCSGGVHSYAAAQADDRIAGLLMYDTYYYPTARSRLNRYLRPIQKLGLAAIVGRALQRIPQKLAQRWRIWRGLETPAPGPQWAGLFTTPPKDDYVRVLRALHERGTKVGVMMSGALWTSYPGQFHDGFAASGITSFVTQDFMAGMEHNAALLHEQADFMRRIEAWTADLDAKLRPAPAR